MFAVPGWSISAEALKTQTGSNPSPSISKAAILHKSHHPNGTNKKKSRKRKRGNGSSNALEVTDENLGDLWRRHIEEKTLDPHQQQKEKDKKRHQSSEARDDILEEVENVHGGSFEAFSEEDQWTRLTEEGAPPPKKKKERKGEGHTPAGSVQVNDHEDATEMSPTLLEEQDEVKDGKSKYEQRKAKVAKKHQQRAILQASGTLPPPRPENVFSHPTKNTPTKPFKSSKASSALQKPSLVEPRKNLRASEPPEPSRAPDNTQTLAPLPLPSTKLTPLQQRMAAKLTSARFRHLNQTLYTTPSDQAMRLFADSPQNYTSYHAGFRAQVAVWPQNPVECFIEDIKTRGKVSVPSQKKLWREQKKKGKKSKGGSNGDDAKAISTTTTTHGGGGEKLDPLPRSSSNGICTIADLGCGDATLAGSLSSSAAKHLNLNLLSFDLAKGDSPHAHLITVADITNLSAAGVKNGSVDVAICCLSLMGTNWVDVVGECARVVRAGGEVWVAEIKSRFGRAGVGKKKKGEVGGGGIGRNKVINKGGGKGKGKGKGKDEEDEDEDEDAMALEEEVDDTKTQSGKEETDVGAFVEVFRKRGLLLKGEPDMTNKMFVRMRFVKGLVGVGVGAGGRMEKEKGDGAGGRGGKNMFAKTRTRFVDDDDDDDDGNGVVVDESKVLKPCVYKTR